MLAQIRDSRRSPIERVGRIALIAHGLEAHGVSVDHQQAADQPFAEAELAEIDKAGFDDVHFAWSGGTEPGQPHYYRVQGPTFLLEYDNTQNNANHVHSVWRDFDSDFGVDLLGEHVKAAHP